MADALDSVNFHCRGCGHRFAARPGAVLEDAESPWHPYRYTAPCPECGAEDVPQAPWERSLMKAWAHATGPRTTEGKAASAANLVGHPTPEEAQRTRFNRLKHGLYARTATFFPARPGRYPHCEGCEYRETVCGLSSPACLKRAELFLKHHIAFETRDPGLLTELRSDTQAGIQALINDMILIIAQDGGPRLIQPEWYTDKDGDVHLVRWVDEKGQQRQVMKYEAHPLLKHLMDYISKNTMTLADMGMTPKVQAEEEAAMGHLEQDRQQREALTDFQRRQQEQTNRLMDLIERGGQRGGGTLIIQDGDA
jgi:hypothetical protein